MKLHRSGKNERFPWIMLDESNTFLWEKNFEGEVKSSSTSFAGAS